MPRRLTLVLIASTLGIGLIGCSSTQAPTSTPGQVTGNSGPTSTPPIEQPSATPSLTADELSGTASDCYFEKELSPEQKAGLEAIVASLYPGVPERYFQYGVGEYAQASFTNEYEQTFTGVELQNYSDGTDDPDNPYLTIDTLANDLTLSPFGRSGLPTSDVAPGPPSSAFTWTATVTSKGYAPPSDFYVLVAAERTARISFDLSAHPDVSQNTATAEQMLAVLCEA